MSIIGPASASSTRVVYPTSSLKFTKTTVGTVATLICVSNDLRRGLVMYNNSANSVYITLGTIGGASNPSGSATDCAYIIPTFATLVLPVGTVCWTGDLYAVRNAGTGNMNVYELQATSANT